MGEAPAEAPAPASEPGSASSAVPEIPNSSWSSTNRSEADNEVAAGGDGAAAAAGAGVVDAGPVQQMVSPLNYAETMNMPVGTSIDIVGADVVMLPDDDDDPIPLADALKRPNARRGTLARTATGVKCTYGNIGETFNGFVGDHG